MKKVIKKEECFKKDCFLKKMNAFQKKVAFIERRILVNVLCCCPVEYP
jgi:hypothetical protein